jgi:acetyl-CoA C-acetyltransferase
VNQVCASSLKALTLAVQSIRLGDAAVAVVVGAENMSLAPRLVAGSRRQKRMGSLILQSPVEATDSMLNDGLWDSFSGKHMGALVDSMAMDSGITRADIDSYVLRSFDRACTGWASGRLDVFEVNGVVTDEPMAKLVREKLPLLRPCFTSGGILTAASSSALADGAAGVVVASSDFAQRVGATPIARIVAYGDGGCDPMIFPAAILVAVRAALKKADLGPDQIDLWEINEAFAMVPLYFMKEMGVPEEKVNVLGGAVAIGHPLGCTGIRIVNTLISALRIRQKRLGLAALCNGGGGSVAVVVELL